jgi:hypothetical protein
MRVIVLASLVIAVTLPIAVASAAQKQPVLPSTVTLQKPQGDRGKDCARQIASIPHGGKKVNGTTPREAAWARCLRTGRI